MRVIGYLRVSTREQADSGLGLGAQRAAINAEAHRRGWGVEWAVDEGVSGSVPSVRRPALGAALETVSRGDVLVAAKLDRLGRSALDVLSLADRARRERWDLIVLDLGLDTSTPVGRFTLTALAGVAELERDLIRQRTCDALAARKAAGVRLGRPVQTPPEVRARIATLRDAGRKLAEIAATLNAAGVTTVQGRAWTAANVGRVLRSVELDRQAQAAGLAG